MAADRSFVDRLEIAAPGLAALIARALGHAPEPLRRRALQGAFDRARDAFNRGDFEVVFGLFDAQVEYVPPPALYEGPPLHGREAVFDFWRGTAAKFQESTIENLSLEEATPSRFVRRARLHHRQREGGETLAYEIVQLTELRNGKVIRQVNETG